MTDPRHTQNLSEISHLFLSGVRDMAQNGAQRPTRIPPGGKPAVSIDMTAEEFAAAQRGEALPLKDSARIGPVAAVLASHFGDDLHERVKSYARHVATTHEE